MNLHAPGNLQLGQVTDNADPDNRGRIKVRLLSAPMELWANLVAASAGHNYGVCCVPRQGEIVVLAFISHEVALVLGSLWSGNASRPANADPHEQHYVIRTPEATVLDFDDSVPQVKLTTRSGYHITISESGGGEITIERNEQSIKLTPSGIDVNAGNGTLNVNAGSVTVTAPQLTVNAASSVFKGVLQADTVITNAVVGTTYTPGAGNIW